MATEAALIEIYEEQQRWCDQSADSRGPPPLAPSQVKELTPDPDRSDEVHLASNVGIPIRIVSVVVDVIVLITLWNLYTDQPCSTIDSRWRESLRMILTTRFTFSLLFMIVTFMAMIGDPDGPPPFAILILVILGATMYFNSMMYELANELERDESDRSCKDINPNMRTGYMAMTCVSIAANIFGIVARAQDA